MYNNSNMCSVNKRYNRSAFIYDTQISYNNKTLNDTTPPSSLMFSSNNGSDTESDLASTNGTTAAATVSTVTHEKQSLQETINNDSGFADSIVDIYRPTRHSIDDVSISRGNSFESFKHSIQSQSSIFGNHKNASNVIDVLKIKSSIEYINEKFDKSKDTSYTSAYYNDDDNDDDDDDVLKEKEFILKKVRFTIPLNSSKKSTSNTTLASSVTSSLTRSFKNSLLKIKGQKLYVKNKIMNEGIYKQQQQQQHQQDRRRQRRYVEAPYPIRGIMKSGLKIDRNDKFMKNYVMNATDNGVDSKCFRINTNNITNLEYCPTKVQKYELPEMKFDIKSNSTSKVDINDGYDDTGVFYEIPNNNHITDADCEEIKTIIQRLSDDQTKLQQYFEMRYNVADLTCNQTFDEYNKYYQQLTRWTEILKLNETTIVINNCMDKMNMLKVNISRAHQLLELNLNRYLSIMAFEVCQTRKYCRSFKSLLHAYYENEYASNNETTCNRTKELPLLMKCKDYKIYEEINDDDSLDSDNNNDEDEENYYDEIKTRKRNDSLILLKKRVSFLLNDKKHTSINLSNGKNIIICDDEDDDDEDSVNAEKKSSCFSFYTATLYFIVCILLVLLILFIVRM